MAIYGLQREKRFSPNSVDKDYKILRSVITLLGGTLCSDVADLCRMTSGSADKTKAVVSMARGDETLNQLETLEKEGVLVVNPPQGIRNCCRSRLNRMMMEHGLPLPASDSDGPCWLKRGDAVAQYSGDVVFCENHDALKRGINRFAERGITDYVVQKHIEGDLIKFYGVEGTAFFRMFYPTEDGDTKFDDERRNGHAHYYDFDKKALRMVAEKLSRLTSTPVYGGDAVITSDGSFFLIDFNDFPSFSRCRSEAANAIAQYVGGKLSENNMPDTCPANTLTTDDK